MDPLSTRIDVDAFPAQKAHQDDPELLLFLRQSKPDSLLQCQCPASSPCFRKHRLIQLRSHGPDVDLVFSAFRQGHGSTNGFTKALGGPK